MDRRNRIRLAVYAMIAADAVFLFLLVLAVQNKPTYLPLAAAIYLLVVLISNSLFLRRKVRLAGPPRAEQRREGHSGSFSLYAASVIFFAGTLYGVLLFLHGDLPGKVLPILLVPFSLAVYILRTARRNKVQKPS
jgi:hypothetical protein